MFSAGSSAFWFAASQLALLLGAGLILLGAWGTLTLGAPKQRPADQRIDRGEAAATQRARNSTAADANPAAANTVPQRVPEEEARDAEPVTPAENESSETRHASAPASTSRRISKDSALRMAEKLQPFAGTKFDMAITPGDAQAGDLLAGIEYTAVRGDWREVAWKGRSPTVFHREGFPSIGSVTLEGVVVQVHPNERSLLGPAAAALVDLLQDLGIESRLDIGSALGGSSNAQTIHIMVGKKPVT